MTNAHSSPLLLIRADAGPRIGAGHVMRCLALGQAWQAAGGQVALATGQLPGRLIRRLEQEEFQVLRINSESVARDTHQVSQLIDRLHAQWLVLDGYRFDDQYQQLLTLNDCQLLAMDDFGHATHQRAELVVNQNLYAAEFESAVGNASPIRLNGPEFVCLRNEFLNQAGQPDASTKPLRSRARRLVVTMGGGDPENVTLRVLKLVEQVARDRTVVDVVSGPCNPHFEALQQFSRQSKLTVRIHANVDRMSSLFDFADLAITAGGSTCYELCRCGVPMLIVPIADNQQAVAKALAESGAAECLQPAELPCTGPWMLKQLLTDADQRRSMSDLGRRTIDGHGANRVTRQMLSRLFRFRRANGNDAQLLHQWRNDPEIRATCFDDSCIPFESHVRWLDKKLQDPRTMIWIIENRDGKPVGQIRLDSNNETQATISIQLTPSLRGRGLGTAFIEFISYREVMNRPGLEILAFIKPTNAASQSAFRKAGFRAASTTTIRGQVALQFRYRRAPLAVPQRVSVPMRKRAS